MRNRERGSAILEFGLIAVVLFAFIFGIIDFGRALYTYHFVANAAREATRYASVRGTKCQFTTACPAVASDIASYAGSITPGGIDASVVVRNTNASWPGTSPGTNNAGCDAEDNGAHSPGCVVQVQVTYPFNFILPLMPKGTCSIQDTNGTTETGNICMTSTSEMVITQ
jgi:Flp pilus assembly protein TadG